MLAATPAARGWDFAQDWLSWAAANEPEVIMERLAAAQPGATPGALVELCVMACRKGIDPDKALRALAKTGALTDEAFAFQVLTGLQPGLAAAAANEDVANAWLFKFSELLAAGEFGIELGQQLRVLVSERTLRDLWLELRFLEIFAATGRNRECEWTADERDQLTAIASEIESMLRKSRKFQLPKKFRNPFGGSPEEDVPRGGAEQAGVKDAIPVQGELE
jgi:hypothetical protein